MSYQQPPDDRAGAAAGAPPGWYPDTGGLQALRWWDGAQWTLHTQPLPGPAPQPSYPGEAASVPEGYGAFGQESTGRHARQSAPPDSTAYPGGMSTGPYPASIPAAQPQQPGPYQPQEPDQPPGWAQQQPLAPGPQPQTFRAKQRPRNRKARDALIGVGTLIGIIVAISVATSHNSPSGNTAATSPAATATAAGTATPPSCQDQAVSWKDNGGASGVDAIMGDLSGIQKAGNALVAASDAGGDLSSAESALQSASASLQSDAQSAEADLPPACIPGVRGPYAQGLADYSKAAGDFQDSVSEMSSGSYAVATGDVEAGTKAMSAGNKQINTATTALTAFDNSQS